MADELPKTDKGWQAHLSNARPPAAREWLAIGGGLVVCREPSGTQTFQGRIRRKGERNPSRIAIGAFPAASVAEARRRLLEMKSLAREGRDLALDQRRERAGVVKLRTLGDLIRETLARREGQVAPKTLKIERDLLVGVLAPTLGGRLLSDLEPIDFGKAVADYAARLKRGGDRTGPTPTSSWRHPGACSSWRGVGGLVAAADPTAGLSRPVKEAPRDRVLFDGKVLVGPDPSVNELGSLVVGLAADPSPVPVSRPTRIALMLTLCMGFGRWRRARSNGARSVSTAMHPQSPLQRPRRVQGCARSRFRRRRSTNCASSRRRPRSTSVPGRARGKAREAPAPRVPVAGFCQGMRALGYRRRLDA
jgi:Arm DNA-binding domain